MHKFFRIFALIIFLSLAMVLVALGFIYRNAINKELVESTQSESVALTRVLGAAIKENPHIVDDIKNMSVNDFRRSPGFTLLDKITRRHVSEFEALQVNVFTLDGIVIYSTDMSLLGSDRPSLSVCKSSQSGQTNSALVNDIRFYTMTGVTQNRDAVRSCIPVDWSGDGNFDVIVQVYIDVTGRGFGLGKIQNSIYISLILLFLFTVLAVMIKLADKKFQLHSKEMTRHQQEIKQFASRDSLTGLANRRLFKDRLEQAMRQVCQFEKLLAVISIDLDRFKFINDKYGFVSGDEVLLQVAERIKMCVHNSDAVSRFEGGHFVILIEDISVVDEAAEAARHVLDAMLQPFHIHDEEVFITCSLGIAMYPFDDEQAVILIQKSVTAMHQAKEAGRNTYRLYNYGKREKSVTRFTLENTLRRAIERNEFQLYYQPVVQLNTGMIAGAEALLRWHLPSGDIVSPLEFISVLEESGLIIKVGQWVLETACMQGMKWRQMGYGDLKINVNISAKQFKNIDFLQHVSNALEMSKIPSHLLNLEITESLLIENRDRVIRMLDQLNDKGVSMSVDDFGTGYSSMAYLKNMPIETIKIDKTFVQGIPYDMDNVAIIHAIDYLSKNLRLNVIAEGVETESQLNFLRKLNVYAIQGYLISRPVPVSEFEILISQHVPFLYKT